ncbi:gas vesicle protein K [Streptomyces omiyaensis]|uniref:Gas vesicle protein K n=1 Tax=Streptomyces omiyaensis TaxID=68247 RepID=A0ABW7BW94_9ACTN
MTGDGPRAPRPPAGSGPDPAPGPRGTEDVLAQAFRLVRAPPGDPAHTSPAHRVATDPERVGEDLLKLVLTLVELLRQLVERQALRRVDAGDLTEEQEEELGATLLALHDALAGLCAEHGYALEDLNLDLGPLGPLLPRE